MQRTLFLFLTAVVLGALPALPAGAQNEVGRVEGVRIYAYGTPPLGERGPLYAYNDVYMNHVVETVAKGAIRIKFKDDTELRMGESSKLVIDQLVYNPEANQHAAAFTLVSGLFRYISGKIDKKAVAIFTPDAVVGIRGTDLQFDIGKSGTDIFVFKGAIEVVSKRSGQRTVVPAGQGVSIGSTGGVDRTDSIPFQPDSSLSDRATGHRGPGSGDGGGTSTGGSSGGGGGVH